MLHNYVTCFFFFFSPKFKIECIYRYLNIVNKSIEKFCKQIKILSVNTYDLCVFIFPQARAAVPSRRHLFLGQVLLLGLFLLAGLSAAASLAPNPMSCGALRLVGLPAALVFAALLVKCVFLLSLNSGVYLPAPYQVCYTKNK